MEARSTLVSFLRTTLSEKRDRFVGFASKSKTERKFLESLPSLRDAIRKHDTSCLIVTADARYGIWCEEVLVDAMLYIRSAAQKSR